MRHQATRQRKLFEDSKSIPLPQLQQTVQQDACRLLVQWMEALAKSIDAEVENEQNRR